MTAPEQDQTDIHTYFGLTYANYLVLHRTLLQSMPEEWQHKFVAMLEELDGAFAHIEQPEAYEVITGREVIVGDASEHELQLAGVTAEHPDDGETDDEVFYTDRMGRTLEPYARIVVPQQDPVPPYDRGRTHIEPRFPSVVAR